MGTRSRLMMQLKLYLKGDDDLLPVGGLQLVSNRNRGGYPPQLCNSSDAEVRVWVRD